MEIGLRFKLYYDMRKVRRGAEHQRQNKSPNGFYRAFKVSRQRESNPLNYGKEYRKNSVFINSWSISWNTFKDLYYFFRRIVENYFGFR